MNPWLAAFLMAMALFQLVAIPALWLKKNDLADVLWGPAFPLCAGAAVLASGGTPAGREAFTFALLVAWATRLFAHVGWRNLAHLHREDVRYNNWRKQWGKTAAVRSYFQVFVLQPLILYVFLLPTLAILTRPAEAGWGTWLGGAVWLAGFFCEALADEQLRRFKADAANRGKLMTSGIWSWSRHPNYFGEILLWWGVWLIALDSPGAWWTVAGPLGVTYLILRVSGVSMLEDLMRSRPGYEDYARRVPRLVPVPPALRRGSGA